MIRNHKRKWIGSLLLLLTAFIVTSTPFHDVTSLPKELRLFEGSLSQLKLSVPVMGTLVNSNPEILQVNGIEAREVHVDFSQPLQVAPKKVGQARLQWRVGKLPIKEVKVNVLPDLKVIPGGQSIGVKLQTAGVLVVGHHLVDTGKEKVSPGEKSGIHVGDMIVKMNDLYINDMSEVKKIVNEAGAKNQSIQLMVVRGKEKIVLTLKPAQDKKDNQYRMVL